MKIALIFLLFLSCISSRALAQQPEITPDSSASSDTLSQWLHSGNPRLIAWAADLSQRRHDERVTSQISGLLEHWSSPIVAQGYNESRAAHLAILALLDALIQENVQVSIQVIDSMADQFPAQAVLLIQRVPLKLSKSTLMNWAFDHNGAIKDERARVAAMMLAKEPDPSFVYGVVKNAEQHLTIHVVRQNTGFGGGSATDCGDTMPLPITPGWPHIYSYGLIEQQGSHHAPGEIPVVDLGGRSVVAQRHEEGSGWGACNGGQSEATLRQQLIAYWLGINPRDMPWQLDKSLTISWTTRSAYERELGSLVEKQRAKMMDTFLKLQTLGLLNRQSSDAMVPRLLIEIECDIDPCPISKAPAQHR